MSIKSCYHCGTDCTSNSIEFENKNFCCNGCKTVFEILNGNDLSCYYDLEIAPGNIPKEFRGKFNYLDNEDIKDKLLEFTDGEISVVTLYIPTIHCSSCIWILENLNKLNNGITTSIVNFPEKKIRITFNNSRVSLKQVAELISSVGYEPYISLENADSNFDKVDNTLLYQLSVAAFAFGNVMLLSFPEYFQVDEFWLEKYKHIFRWLMFTMSVPVVIYSAKGFYVSAYKGLRHKILNIDVPIALGISVLFLRSTVEIVLDIGTGFFDSLTGLVFFLLIGKIFQQKTYNFLSFERDYKSYFPIAVTKILNGEETNIPVNSIEKGDRLLIRNEELIPVDGILINGHASIDYSFVTGESNPVEKNSGDKLFAGGKQTQGAIEMEVVNTISQSYLTQLWSNDVFNKTETVGIKNITDRMSKYFTIVLLSIALTAGIFWYFYMPSMAINVVTAVLIIACPCALALSAPFSLGNMLRIFGYNKLYVKNAVTIENIAKIDTIVFDKTGTISSTKESDITYRGIELNENEKIAVKSLLRESNHPLSRALYEFFDKDLPIEKPENFDEFIGKGITGKFGALTVKLGSGNFVENFENSILETAIHISVNNEFKGSFVFKNSYRIGLKEVFLELSLKHKLIILSGDNEGEKEYLERILPKSVSFYFNQKPEDKLNFINQLQVNGSQVMMVGDGLNDSGALAQSNVGISISENVNVFSPACDAILDAKLFNKLPKFLTLSNKTMSIIRSSFIFSLIYNVVGLYFALTGQLVPVVAAILMPLSSITIVVYVTILTNYISKRF